jgi:porphyrinogen peroxidase
MKYAPQINEQRNDIQAILGSGFGWLTSSRFYLLTIKDDERAKLWFAQLAATKLIKSVSELAECIATETKPAELCAVGFSYAGLKAFGIEETEDFPFPTPFRCGMGSPLRERLLRDSPRDQWKWGDTTDSSYRAVVHILLGHWWDSKRLNPLQHSQFPKLSDEIFSYVNVDGCPSFFRQDNALYEPFGFRDGLSQPMLFGLKDHVSGVIASSQPQTIALKAKSELARDHVVAAGEVVLGYRNEYNELGYCADVKGWRDSDASEPRPGAFALNGSYIAVRQIEQDVAAFEEMTKSQLEPITCPIDVTRAEKIMGRRRDAHGTPLGWTETACPMNDSDANLFRYRVQDAAGFATPRGAHIRRANPRDTLGHDVDSGVFSSKLHRLLRRGRPYRGKDGDKETQGIFFMACNADLERQFEFVYQRWIRNPRFNDLDGEDDPLLGASSDTKGLTIQGLPSGAQMKLDDFTTTLGGGYFFLPGLNALEFIRNIK